MRAADGSNFQPRTLSWRSGAPARNAAASRSQAAGLSSRPERCNVVQIRSGAARCEGMEATTATPGRRLTSLLIMSRCPVSSLFPLLDSSQLLSALHRRKGLKHEFVKIACNASQESSQGAQMLSATQEVQAAAVDMTVLQTGAGSLTQRPSCLSLLSSTNAEMTVCAGDYGGCGLEWRVRGDIRMETGRTKLKLQLEHRACQARSPSTMARRLSAGM